MKLTRAHLLLAACAALFLTASCSQAPDAEKDPSADAAYKRAHRAELYRDAQRSNVTRN
jgi:outer membrane biogenesis lipoprotein LolB